jgi:hypothetical protein
MWQIGIMPHVTIYNHPKWMVQILFIYLFNFFQFSIIMPHGKVNWATWINLRPSNMNY